jgi:Uma2 family endonuclease
VLLIEILAPEAESQQRAKLYAYAALPTVQEILFIESLRIRAELHRRLPDGSWSSEPEVVVGTDILRLESCGLEVLLAECYPFLELAEGEG